MGGIGGCCCRCDGCCISHIKVNMLRANDPENGAGTSLEWDVETQPAVTRSFETIDGVNQEICVQTFLAPRYPICGSTIPSANIEFNVLHREIDATGRYFLTGPGGSYSNFEFIGSEVWRDNILISNLAVTIQRSASKIRVFVSSGGAREYTHYPKPGSTGLILDSSCSVINTINFTAERRFDWCKTFSTPFNSILYFPSGSNSGDTLLSYAPYIDTGWFNGGCASLTTIESVNRTFIEFFRPDNPFWGTGQIPFGRNRVTHSGYGCIGEDWSFSYASFYSYLFRDSVEFNLC